MPKSKRKNNKRGGGGSNTVDRYVVNSHKMTGSTTQINPSDFKSPSANRWMLTQSPPKNFAQQIHWVELTYSTVLGASSTGPTEANAYFNANFFNGFSDFSDCFDAYCLYSVTCAYVSIASGSTSGPPIRLHTAIDYDNTTNIGLPTIMEFTSYQLDVLVATGNTSAIRYVKPAVAIQVQNATTGLPVPGAIGRCWLDMAYSGTAHYGIRQIVDQFPTNTSSAVNVNYTGLFGFRYNN